MDSKRGCLGFQFLVSVEGGGVLGTKWGSVLVPKGSGGIDSSSRHKQYVTGIEAKKQMTGRDQF